MTAPSIKEALTARAQAFLDRKYVTRSDARQKAMGLGYIEAERQDLAREVARFCESEVERHFAATLQPSGDRREAIARGLSISYGEDPDDFAFLTEICGPNNEPLQNWHKYTEQADYLLASGLVQDEADWRTMDSAPKDGTVIFVRRDNGCSTDYMVVWWNDTHNDGYPWRSDNNAYVEDRWDEWMLPPIRSAHDGGAET